jgi:hypothetical protein
MARPSGGEKAGAIRKPAHREATVSKRRTWQGSAVSWRLNIQGTPTSRVVTVQEISGGLV